MDIPSTPDNEKQKELHADIIGPSGTFTSRLYWVSSNEKVATVQQNSGDVEGVSPGKAVITAYAKDGSGKKATCTVTVTVPASSIALQESGAAQPLAYGRSAQLTARLGNAYGAPTSKKVAWSLSSTEPTVQEWIDAKLITVSSAGKVSVSAKLKNTTASYPLTVTASATDGTGLQASKELTLAPGATYIQAAESAPVLHMGAQREKEIQIYTDMALPREPGTITVESSNPKVAGGSIHYNQYGNPYLKIVAYGKGRATITIRTTDGSGVSTRVTVKVQG